MTTIIESSVRCALCGGTGAVPVVLSHSSFGPPDMDLRPAPPARDAVEAMIQRCASCGYAAADISKAGDGVGAIVAGAAYQAILREGAAPVAARLYLCSALVSRSLGEWGRAGKHALAAAWVCDDEGDTGGAIACRSRAAEDFVEAHRRNLRFMESGAAEWLVIADIQRRAHRFAAGLESCVRAERADSNAALAPFIDFQRRLLAVDDDACHSMAEVARR